MLLVDGSELPPSDQSLVTRLLSHPSIVSANSAFLDQDRTPVPPSPKSVCVLQREQAFLDLSVEPDGITVGSQDATTCLIVLLYCPQTSLVWTAHLDGGTCQHPALTEALQLMQQPQLYLTGSFSEESGESELVCSSVLRRLHASKQAVHVKLACIMDTNTAPNGAPRTCQLAFTLVPSSAAPNTQGFSPAAPNTQGFSPAEPNTQGFSPAAPNTQGFSLAAPNTQGFSPSAHSTQPSAPAAPISLPTPIAVPSNTQHTSSVSDPPIPPDGCTALSSSAGGISMPAGEKPTSAAEASFPSGKVSMPAGKVHKPAGETSTPTGEKFTQVSDTCHTSGPTTQVFPAAVPSGSETAEGQATSTLQAVTSSATSEGVGKVVLVRPANFADRGPELFRRMGFATLGQGGRLTELYNTRAGCYVLPGFDAKLPSWHVFHLERLVGLPDDEFLQHCSTSPDYEPEHFVNDWKCTYAWLVAAQERDVVVEDVVYVYQGQEWVLVIRDAETDEPELDVQPILEPMGAHL